MRAEAPTPDDLAGGLVFSSHADIIGPRGERVLSVPVSGGRVVTRLDQPVPDGVEGLILPDKFEGEVLAPRRRGAVLGVDGHRVALTTTIRNLSRSRVWRVPMGVYVVTDVEAFGGYVRVHGAGMLERTRARLRPMPGGTEAPSPLAGELLRILSTDGLEMTVDSRLPDRVLPAGYAWGADRLRTVMDLVRAWPAMIVMDGRGSVQLRPPPSGAAPVITWTHGEPGQMVHTAPWQRSWSATLIDAPDVARRDGVVNHVIVVLKGGTGEDGEERPDQYVQQHVMAGRYAVHTFGWVSELVEDDAITSYAQAQQVAAERIAQAGRRSWVLDIDAVPTWLPEVGDSVAVRPEDETLVGVLAGTDMPLTPAEGPARYQVEVHPL